MDRRPLLLTAAMAALIALLGVSAAIAATSLHATSSGLALGVVKLVVLGLVLLRVRAGDAYAMQWSSMLILLFVAEVIVRAMTDAPPSAALGALETAFAVAYFVMALAYLRPLKKRAREAVR